MCVSETLGRIFMRSRLLGMMGDVWRTCCSLPRAAAVPASQFVLLPNCNRLEFILEDQAGTEAFTGRPVARCEAGTSSGETWKAPAAQAEDVGSMPSWEVQLKRDPPVRCICRSLHRPPVGHVGTTRRLSSWKMCMPGHHDQLIRRACLKEQPGGQPEDCTYMSIPDRNNVV